MVYVTSQPIHAMVLEYYFELLAGIPASHARSRLTLLCAYDSSPRSLTEKILDRPRLIERASPRAATDPSRAYLTVFNATPHERRLAVLLGIPMNGADPDLAHLGTKSGSRKVFREAGVALPEGLEDLTGRDDVVDGLVELNRRRPGLKRAVVKLNDSFSGEGNAIVRYPESGPRDRSSIEQAVDRMSFIGPGESTESYFGKFERMGGIVEEFLEAREKVSPSAQLRTSPSGEVQPISTHDQVLGGPDQQVYLGCTFPARDPYRRRIQDEAVKVGEVLARYGVVSRFAVDFLLYRDTPEQDWMLGARDQPADGQHHAPLSRLALPDRRQPRSLLRLVLLGARSGEVLPGHRQSALAGLSRPLARGPDRHPHREPLALRPQLRFGRSIPT